MKETRIPQGNGLREALLGIFYVSIVAVPLLAVMWWSYSDPQNPIARVAFPTMFLVYLLVGIAGGLWLLHRKSVGGASAGPVASTQVAVRPMDPWRTTWRFFVVGAVLWAVAFLPWVTGWSAGGQRGWVAPLMGYLGLVGPVASIVVGVLAAQNAAVRGLSLLVGVVGLGMVINGITWSLGALVVDWTRHHARRVFAVLVGLLASYWALGLVIVVMVSLP